MANQLTIFLKLKKKEILTGGIVGAVVYLVSKNFVTDQFSTLQSGLSVEVLIDKVGVTLEIKTLIFFIILGILISLLVDGIIKSKK